MSTPYPFTALVGQTDLRLALLLNAVSPAVGGVLVRGEKGTAKSTAVRALSTLLPQVDVVPGCRFSCAPAAPDPGCPDGPHEPGAGTGRPARMVELPVGASEDRLVGALDIERALAEGVKAFEPGLLADAHRGILYVDEVNLLHDHLIDLLLDAAAMGASYVEREGISVRHAARFLLVGTMNPEEGELRPQLLDRFGLTVEVAASREPVQRVEVVRRRLAYEDDPAAFAGRWAGDEDEVRARVVAARGLLPKVVLGDTSLLQIAATCAGFEVDGMRADIVMARTATALAAWAGRTEVRKEDVRQAALLALPTGAGAIPSTPPASTRRSSTGSWTSSRTTSPTTSRSRSRRARAKDRTATATARTAAVTTAAAYPRRGPVRTPPRPRTTGSRRPGPSSPPRPPSRSPPGRRPRSPSRPPYGPPSRSAPRCSAFRGSARARPAAGRAPAPRTGAPPAPSAPGAI